MSMVQSTIELVVHVTVTHPEGTPAPECIGVDASLPDDLAGHSVDEVAVVGTSVVTEGIKI